MVRRGLIRRVFRGACLVLILWGIGVHGVDGETPRARTEERTVAVFFGFEGRDSDMVPRADEEELLRSGILTNLAAELRGYSFVLIGNAALDRRDRSAVAAGADAWVSVRLEWRDTAIDVRVTVKDLYYEDPGTTMVYQIPREDGFRGNTGRYWFPAVSFVESRLLSPEYETLILISGVPGTSVNGLGEDPFVLGEEGTREVSLPFGETFRYRADARRYHTVEGVLRTASPEARLFLSQPPRGRFSYELFLSGFSYPGVGISHHVVPAWSMVRFDLFTYAFGIIPYADVGGEEGSLFASEPASHVTLWFLQHLLPPGRRLRPYLGVGGTLRMLHAQGSIRKEPIAPYGVTAVIGVEAGRGYGSWFFEYAPLFYLVAEPQLWDDQFSSRQPGYLRIDDNALDLMMVRVGFRWTPPGWRSVPSRRSERGAPE